VAWTNEGRNESVGAVKKTLKLGQGKPKNSKWSTKEELLKWIASTTIDDDIDVESDCEQPSSSRSVGDNKADQQESVDPEQEVLADDVEEELKDYYNDLAEESRDLDEDVADPPQRQDDYYDQQLKDDDDDDDRDSEQEVKDDQY